MSGPSEFSGWAIIELFGHQREVGYVTSETFGQAVLFRIEVPEAAGAPARTRLVGPGAVYAINPCTEAAARALLERTYVPVSRLAISDGEDEDAAEVG